MTRKRNDEHSTEFGLWLREQPEIDSKLGYIATNLDYIWENYKTSNWMYIEEKRFMTQPTWSQQCQFDRLIQRTKNDKFYGFHLLQFEYKSPEDGKIFWDKKEITKSELLLILQFKI